MVHAGPPADHLVDILQVQAVGAKRAAEHAVGLAAVEHQRPDKSEALAHFDLGVMHRDAAALCEPVVFLPVIAVTGIIFRIDELEVHTRPDAKSESLDAFLYYRRATDENRQRKTLIDHHLDGAQNALVL